MYPRMILNVYFKNGLLNSFNDIKSSKNFLMLSENKTHELFNSIIYSFNF